MNDPIKFNIGMVTATLVKGGAGIENLTNIIKILRPSCDEMYVFTGNFPEDRLNDKKIHLKNIKGDVGKKSSLWLKIPKFIMLQLRLSFNLIKAAKNVDIVVFYLGSPLIVPICTTKLLRKKIVMIGGGSQSKTLRKNYQGMVGFMLSFVFHRLENVGYALSDLIAVQSKSVIPFVGLGRYREKISINGALYIDTNHFNVRTELENRENLLGYIGRLTEGKGVINLINALPVISSKCPDVKFLIGGDGPLFSKIVADLKACGMYNKTSILGWIPHEQLPEYLNRLRLIILPTYTEGLPGIIQESMACGTPVLATPVGGIPDLIKDGKTGFIMEDNSPECIAMNVIRALEHPNPDENVKNARKLIENEYTYDAMVEKFRRAIDELMEKR